PLSLADAGKAAALLPSKNLLGMTPFRYIPVRSSLVPYTAVGTDFQQVRKTSPSWRIQGRWPEKENEILAGTDIAEFSGLTPGKTLTLDGRTKSLARFQKDLLVTGILRTGGAEDGFFFMDLSAMAAMTGEEGLADAVEISLEANEADLRRLSAAVHQAVPGLEARLVKRVTQSEAAVLGKLDMLVTLVTLVVLILTMICVATTMMAVVMERRREIGLKMALGAEKRRVAGEFLAEGALLGAAGGLTGGACGFLFAQLVCTQVFGRSIEVVFSLIPLTILVSVAVTMAACLIPARQAMDVEPALVLRGE
ncbi:MAG: ABC transporter permease, partial [Deltaproteobacteria bacterium]|nr:ABC transporter permease [Deltaproteobacteria bacterium]